MSLESAADPAIAKIEPIKISYITLKLTCKGLTAEKNIKCLLFFVMKSLCFYRSRKLCIYSKDPAMQSPPHLNLSHATSGSLCSTQAAQWTQRKLVCCVFHSKATVKLRNVTRWALSETQHIYYAFYFEWGFTQCFCSETSFSCPDFHTPAFIMHDPMYSQGPTGSCALQQPMRKVLSMFTSQLRQLGPGKRDGTSDKH